MSEAVLGIDIGGTKVALCLASRTGAVLASRVFPTEEEQGAAAVVANICAAAQTMTAGTTVLGVGAVTPGVVEPTGIRLAPNNRGWETLAIETELRHRLDGAPVRADNDVKSATRAELRWGVLRHATDALLVNLGTGISAGAVVNGAMVRGAHDAALEIAYQVPVPGPLRGYASGVAPLEELVSGSALAAGASRILGRPAHAGDALESTEMTPRTARERALADLASHALDELARAVANLAVVFDPEVVALYGGMLRTPAPLLSRLGAALAEVVPCPPRLVRAAFGERATLAGACLLAYEAAGLTAPPSLGPSLFDVRPAVTNDVS